MRALIILLFIQVGNKLNVTLNRIHNDALLRLSECEEVYFILYNIKSTRKSE